MKLRQLFIFTFLAIICFLIIQPQQANAQLSGIEDNLKAAAETGAGYGSPQDPRTTAAVVIRAVLGIIGIVFTVLMIYAGVLWMTAAGNEDQVTKAKQTISRSAIGLLIILLSYALTIFVVFIARGGLRNSVATQPPQETFIPFE